MGAPLQHNVPGPKRSRRHARRERGRFVRGAPLSRRRAWLVTQLAWRPSYRIIPSRYPYVTIYDRVSDPGDLEAVIEIEQLTNPRVRVESGNLALIRPEDRIAGPGTTPVMASFAYTASSRFSDGTFGVYYAAHSEDTAVAETTFHAERRLRTTNEPSIDLDMRVYTATIKGEFDDVRKKTPRSKLYDPNSYVFSQIYGMRKYRENVVDGIVYRSVRDSAGECLAAFRPRLITNCVATKYLQYRWSGERIVHVAQIDLRPSDV